MPDRSSASPPACRPARPEDLDSLLALEAASFSSDRLSRRQMRYHLRNPRTRIWVCGGRDNVAVAALVGFFHSGRPARLYSLATAPAWRGRGLGGALVGTFLAEARRQRYARAVLEVRKADAATIRLYEKNGFHRVRDLPAYYADGADGVKMAADLTAAGRKARG